MRNPITVTLATAPRVSRGTSATTYMVGVGRSWHASTGNPAPDYTCGHKHRTRDAAVRCAEKLYASRYVNGSWTANARWHDAYVIDSNGGRA